MDGCHCFRMEKEDPGLLQDKVMTALLQNENQVYFNLFILFMIFFVVCLLLAFCFCFCFCLFTYLKFGLSKRLKGHLGFAW